METLGLFPFGAQFSITLDLVSALYSVALKIATKIV